MTVPLQITFRKMEPSPALEARRREKAGRLEHFSSRLQCCRVIVEAPHRRQRHGRLHRARIEVEVPRGEVPATLDSQQNLAHEDPCVAVRDTFDAALRRLEHRLHRLDGQARHRDAPLPHGRVVRFVADSEYGPIGAGDGQEVRFHHNRVRDRGFDGPRIGGEARRAVAEGENGPQADAVDRTGKRNPVR